MRRVIFPHPIEAAVTVVAFLVVFAAVGYSIARVIVALTLALAGMSWPDLLGVSFLSIVAVLFLADVVTDFPRFERD